MSTHPPKPVSIPRSRRAIAVLRDDGTGELRINGVTQPLRARSVDEARTFVLERVSAHAQEDRGGPVRLLASDPAGSWELAVYPDGHVSELASRPFAADAVTPPRAWQTPRRAPSAARAHSVRSRPRIRRRAVVLLTLLSVIAAVTAVALSADDPALPLPSRADNATPLDTVTTSGRASPPRATLKHRPPVISTTPSTSEGRSSARRARRRPQRALRASASATRRANAARARRANAAPARRAPATRLPAQRTAPSPPVRSRPTGPAPPVAPHRIAPPPPSSTSFYDSG